ncbi:MAG: hypothetical protein NDI62_00415 [Burkholderiales bacterium]|nr:hypothetical protein [Burkholderiales bacterium]
MELSNVISVVVTVGIILFAFYFFWRINPILKAKRESEKKVQEKEELEKEKKIFFEIFGFSLDDDILSFQEQRNHVLKTIGSLEMKAGEYKESFSRFSNFVSSLLEEGKVIMTRDMMYHISKQKFSLLESVNWGLGFRSLEYLDWFCKFIVQQKGDLAAEAKKVAIYFKFNV